MKPATAFLLVPLLAATLVACSQEVPSPPAAPAQPPATATAPAPTSGAATKTATDPAAAVSATDVTAPGATFTVTVASVDCSHDPVAVADVVWDVAALGVNGIAIDVESPGNASKLWAEGGATGKGTTGRWVFANSRFSLREKASGRELAGRTVTSLSCAK